MKQKLQVSAAFIGFEFDHHVQAAQIAISDLKDQGIVCEIKLWSGVAGLKTSVETVFANCKFIDSNLGWHGVLPAHPEDIETDEKIELTEVELKHFSYTFSRTTVLRDPRKPNKKQIKLFKSIVRNAVSILQKEGISHVLFVDLPHSLGDLGIYLAAQRLGLQTVYQEGPFFGGDFINPVYRQGRSLNIKKRHREIEKVVQRRLSQKNLNDNLQLPHYMTANLSYMPSVALSQEPVFRTRIAYLSYEKLNIKRLSSFTDRLLLKSSEILSNVFRLYLTRYYLTDEKKLRNDRKYILVLLQYHPELTTSPSAKDTPFEEERVLALAKSFPNTRIIVREHPSNLKKTASQFFQYRTLKSIKSMQRVKNVKYLLPGDRAEYKNLIKNAFFTVSTSGTVAMESIFLRTPSYHFYDSFASGFPGVSIVNTVQEITEEKTEKLKKELDCSSVDELIDQCTQEILSRELTVGFLSGYHEHEYSSYDYVWNASRVILNTVVGFSKVKL